MRFESKSLWQANTFVIQNTVDGKVCPLGWLPCRMPILPSPARDGLPALHRAGADFIRLAADCNVRLMAHEFNINTVVVALGASIYQRLHGMLMREHLRGTVVNLMAQSVLAYGMRPFVRDNTFGFREHRATWGNRWALTLYTLCVHLAVKATHRPRNSPRRLRYYGLNNMLCYMGLPILHKTEILHLELQICELLNWSLVPTMPAPVEPPAKGWQLPDSPNSVLMEF